jgi:hypothetical protein
MGIAFLKSTSPLQKKGVFFTLCARILHTQGLFLAEIAKSHRIIYIEGEPTKE